jgi:hypothetical protein
MPAMMKAVIVGLLIACSPAWAQRGRGERADEPAGTVEKQPEKRDDKKDEKKRRRKVSRASPSTR